MLTRVERVLALKNIELFHGIPGEVLADIATLLEEETFEKGQYIVNEGDLGKELFMIVQGEVEVVAGVAYKNGDFLVFGCESAGLGDEILGKYASQTRFLPMLDGRVRSLNLASAATSVIFEAMKQNNFSE